jgi:chromosome segregation ATPase
MEKTKVTLTAEELKAIKDLQSELNQSTFDLGSIALQLNELETAKQSVLSKLAEIRQKQNKLGVELNTKYGVGTVDLETGEFIHI